MPFEHSQAQCLQMASKLVGTENGECLELANSKCEEQGYLNPIILQNLGCYFLSCMAPCLAQEH